ncbi:hypothetical protein ACLKA7_017071 [Drosophila subpalustris]
MNWHTGNIAEAVAESKAKDAIFVVYIEGEDEMSAKLGRFLNDSAVCSKLMTSDFVAVKIQGESPTYTQFAALYKVVPVPSIFFIGNSGTPLDVTTGIIEGVDQLVAKIDKVLKLAGKTQEQQTSADEGNQTTSKAVENVETVTVTETGRSIAGADEKAAETEQKTEEVSTESGTDSVSIEEQSSEEAAVPDAIETPDLDSSDDGHVVIDTPEGLDVSSPSAASSQVQSQTVATSALTATSSMLPNAVAASLMPLSVPLVPTAPAPAPSTPSTQSTPDVETTIQQLVEQRKLERQEEEKRRDKENELRRRREGREAQVQQAQTREQELKKMQDRIRRDRQQEQETRERILAQIAADRAEQANRAEVQSSKLSTNTTTSVISADSSLSSSGAADETRLQIRLPDGITRTKAFAVEEPLTTVRVYVTNELLVGSNIRDFTLATSYPRREFKTEDELQSLLDLNLVPNAVLLVLKREHINSVVRTRNNLFNILSSVLWTILTPATMAFDYLNKMGLQRIRQRFMQMVSNVGLVKSPPGRTIADHHPVAVAAAQDASARRNMGLFQGSMHATREAPNVPDSTSDDATSTQSGAAGVDPHYQPPPMIFTEGAIAQQAAQQRSGGVYRRYGESNIRRLADTTKDDDDKATYNGNSTQQQ